MATILVVDDDSLVRNQLSAFLIGLGHDVLVANNGDSAAATYEIEEPDLVITDIVMPAMNGVLLIDQLVSVYPDARIIAISGKEPEKLQRAKSAGAASVLRKPINRDELAVEIRRVLLL